MRSHEDKCCRKDLGVGCLLLVFLLVAGFFGVTVYAKAAPETDGSEYTRALAKKNQEFDPVDAAIVDKKVGIQEQKEFTLMIYMIGSNLESMLGSASADIAEMEDAGLDFDTVNLLLYTGGSARWQAGVPCDRNCVVDMSREGQDRIVAGTAKNADMGAQETLSAFVNFCTENYPAEGYGLILWDHGGGPLWGYGADELFQGDGLLLSEMKLAMSHTIFAGSERLSFVGFDACLMGNLENMTVWSQFADYYVGSEELEPGDGWDYHFLKTLNKTKDGKKIGTAIVDAYSAYYKKQRSSYYDPDLTLSVVDLSKAAQVQAELSSAAGVMTQILERDGFQTLYGARADAKSFGITGRAEDNTAFYYDMVDLGSLAKELARISKKDGEALSKSLKALIVKNYSNMEGAEGVSLYYPSDNRSQYYEMREQYDRLGLNREYSDYLGKVSEKWQSAEKYAWKLNAPVLEDKEYTMALTQEQVDNAAKVTYAILERKSDGEYVTVMNHMQVEPDQNGILHFARDPRLIVLSTQGESTLWPVTQVESTAKRRIYQTVNTRLLSSGIVYFRRPTSDAVDVTAVLQEDARSGKLTLKTVNSVSEDVNGVGKETVDVSHYDAIFYHFQQKVPTWNADGELLPIAWWQDGSVNGSRMQVIENEFQFAMCPASDLLEELYYVVTLEDTAGRLYVTEPVKIKPRRGDEMLSVDTEQGKLTFRVFWDHAILYSYSGTDEKVEIPGRVFDTPVTEIAPYAFSRLLMLENSGYVPVKRVVIPNGVKKIGAGAFYNCLQLEEVILPTSLETIGSQGFGNCPSLEKIELPKRLRNIGAYAFAECTSLESVQLPGSVHSIGDGVYACCDSLREITLSGSSAYKVVDGALYTKDGKKLIAYPAACTGSFAVAKGTKTIGPDCFSHSRLEEVLLPDGLESIENYGFYGAKGLSVPVLPESLQSIGKYAFAAGWASLKLSGTQKDVQEIVIGSALSYLGREAFVGFGTKTFSVSAENAWFSVREGALCNKAGDALLEFSTNRMKNLIVPEGVRDLDMSLLEQIGQNDRLDNNHPYQLYVPDSVIRISGHTMFGGDIVLHCQAGSYAEEYANLMGLAVSYEMDPVQRECVVKTDAGELTYYLTGQKAVLVHYEGSDEALTIPASIEGKPVRVIGNGQESIMGNLAYKTLRKMTLPDTVETISAQAFAYFGEFEVNLPDSLLTLGDGALLYCRTPISALPVHLEDLGSAALGLGCSFENGVTIPKSLKRVAPGAFQGIAVPAFQLEDADSDFAVKDGMLFSGDGSILIAAKLPGKDGRLVIPEGTRIIGSYAFSGLPIREMEIPGTVTLIAQYAFANCAELRKITFGEGLENVGSYAFVFTGLESVSLPESCERIGTAAFFGSANLKSLSGAPKTIEAYAFAYCSAMVEAKLGEGVAEIGEYAFYNTDIQQIRLPDSLYQLGTCAFAAENEHLRSVVMQEFYVGRNLSQMGENALGCLPISDFVVHPENEHYAVVERMLTDKAGKKLLACPAGISGVVEVPEGIYEIANYAFYMTENVTDIYIPDSVHVIGGKAFYDHSGSPDGWKRERAKIHCLSGTAAHAFVLERGWPYALTDKDEDGNM